MSTLGRTKVCAWIGLEASMRETQPAHIWKIYCLQINQSAKSCKGLDRSAATELQKRPPQICPLSGGGPATYEPWQDMTCPISSLLRQTCRTESFLPLQAAAVTPTLHDMRVWAVVFSAEMYHLSTFFTSWLSRTSRTYEPLRTWIQLYWRTMWTYWDVGKDICCFYVVVYCRTC